MGSLSRFRQTFTERAAVPRRVTLTELPFTDEHGADAFGCPALCFSRTMDAKTEGYDCRKAVKRNVSMTLRHLA
jgi:hypothetical protein